MSDLPSPLEAVAQAIWQADPTARNMLGPDPTWKELGTAWREHYRTFAAAAMAALELREEWAVDWQDWNTHRLDLLSEDEAKSLAAQAREDQDATAVHRWVSSWTSGSEQ